MSKLYSFYDKNIDTAWYDSSTVFYSKCIDNDNALKTLYVVFKNGTQYRYDEINVNDYLLFRESVSTGKALNKFIKARGYHFEKVDNANVAELQNEYEFRTGKGVMVDCRDEAIVIYDNDGNQLSLFNPNSCEDAVVWALQTVGYMVKNKDTFDDIIPKGKGNEDDNKENSKAE